jgi:tRNA(fMet)-specific endonuclease VapC
VRMTYLVETDWAVHWLRGREDIVSMIHKFQTEGLGLSVISLAELYTGIYYSTDPSQAQQGLDDFLSYVTILEVNQEISRIFGEQNAHLRLEGQVIEDFDLLIAVTCLHHDLKLLTNNRKHFGRIDGLEIISTEIRR